MLLQITEPDTSLRSFSPLYAVGIDLGTTHSVAAVIREGDSTPHVIDLAQGPLLPSVITCVQGGDCIVGKTGLSLDRKEISISSFKRFMNQPAQVLSCGKTPVELSALVLQYIKKKVEESLEQPVYEAVITVPAYFDDTARQATKDAARLAGLKVLRLLNEPTAAALSYGLDQNASGLYAVYDLGGGTFDLSILKMTQGVFQVLATAGDVTLGGDDIDQAIVDFWGGKVSDDRTTALSLARQAKESLTIQPTWSYKNLRLTQDDLQKLCQPFVDRTLVICQKVLKDAELFIEDIQGLVLVGGSTRLQAVRQGVEAFFQKIPLTNLDPDKIVALGAARQALALTRGSDTLLLDVTPLSLGLETMGGVVEKIILRNTPIPTTVSQEFTTYHDHQTQMKIHIVQGEREFVKDCRSLGEFILTGIPEAPAGKVRVDVTFSLDSDGLLTVSAQEKITRMAQKIEIKPSYGLTEEDLQRMITEGFTSSREDLQQRFLSEIRLQAQQLIDILQYALTRDKDLLQEEEKESFSQALSFLQCLTDADPKEPDVVHQHLQRIVALTRDFSKRKMVSNLHKGLQQLS